MMTKMEKTRFAPVLPYSNKFTQYQFVYIIHFVRVVFKKNKTKTTLTGGFLQTLRELRFNWLWTGKLHILAFSSFTKTNQIFIFVCCLKSRLFLRQGHWNVDELWSRLLKAAPQLGHNLVFWVIDDIIETTCKSSIVGLDLYSNFDTRGFFLVFICEHFKFPPK